jgi:hypothetical protein
MNKVTKRLRNPSAQSEMKRAEGTSTLAAATCLSGGGECEMSASLNQLGGGGGGNPKQKNTNKF